jgi:hypothetical protein
VKGRGRGLGTFTTVLIRPSYDVTNCEVLFSLSLELIDDDDGGKI